MGFALNHYFIRFFLESIRRQDKLKMNQFYFGTMDEYIEATYAPSGRASCRACKQKIEKQTLKLGVCMQNDHFNGKYWYHVPCFKLRPLFKDLNPEEQIYNLDQLEEEDYKIVLEKVNNQLQRLKNGKKAKLIAPNTKSEKSRSKKAKSQPSEDEQPQEEKQVAKTRLTRSKSRNKSKKEQVLQAVKPVKKQAKKKRKKSVKKEEGYTQDQKEKFIQLRNKYMSYGAEKLKEILSLNMQPKTGNKGDLIEKCADGELLGRIPLCSSCGGGKLRFDSKTGIYKCPGYMDDEQFKNCNQLFTLSQIVRQPWKLP